MYPVDAAYLTQMMKSATRRRLTGTIGSVPFTGDDVVRGSFEVSGQATKASDTKIGGVYLGELGITFIPSFLSKVARNEFKDKEIAVSIGLLVGDDWVDIPVGVYTAQAPKISKRGIEVTAYDHMKILDRKFNFDQTLAATPYSYLSFLATACGVELGITQAEVEALPNGTDALGLHPENDIETWRDFLYWLAQACGCFACADRAGKIVLRPFGNPTGVEIDEMHRDNDIVFSGYVTKWTGVSFVDIDTQMTMYYGLEVDDGLTMNLGANPLLQMGSVVAVERRRRAVLNAVAQIQYTPFYANAARDPIFDLGDELSFTGGISGDSVGCVMAYTYSLDNFSFEGYGDDPALANARSKTDKNIAGLMQDTVENEVTYYNYANVDSFSFGSEQEVTIASLAFTSAQPTTVKILHEFIFDMLSDLALDGSYELRYYLDEELLSYQPYERLGAIAGLTEGDTTDVSITRDFFYILKDVEPFIRHTWRVTVTMHNIASVVIDVNHAHVTIEGQRLYGDEYFSGLIEASDLLTIVPLGYLGLVSISDEAEISVVPAAVASGDDDLGLCEIGHLQTISLAEGTGQTAPSIYMEGGYPRLTESGARRVTENGKARITE